MSADLELSVEDRLSRTHTLAKGMLLAAYGTLQSPPNLHDRLEGLTEIAELLSDQLQAIYDQYTAEYFIKLRRLEQLAEIETKLAAFRDGRLVAQELGERVATILAPKAEELA